MQLRNKSPTNRSATAWFDSVWRLLTSCYKYYWQNTKKSIKRFQFYSYMCRLILRYYVRDTILLCVGISALNEIFLLISLLSLHYFRKQLFYFCLVLSTIFYTSSTKDGPGPPSTSWRLCHLVSIVDRVVLV